jgi:hypothetical protein
MGAGEPAAGLAADPGHRGSAEPGGAAAGARRLGRRAHHRGHAAGQPRRGRRPDRHAAPGRGAHPAEHGGMPHRQRGQAGGQAGPRGARHRLGQARGGRRRHHLAARPGRAPRRRPDAGRRRVRGAALHQRRPGACQAARAGRLRGRDAARRADRLGPRDPQPARHRHDRRAGGRPGRPRRRDRHRVGRRLGHGARLRRRARGVRGDARARPGAHAGRIPPRFYAQASSSFSGIADLGRPNP